MPYFLQLSTFTVIFSVDSAVQTCTYRLCSCRSWLLIQSFSIRDLGCWLTYSPQQACLDYESLVSHYLGLFSFTFSYQLHQPKEPSTSSPCLLKLKNKC